MHQVGSIEVSIWGTKVWDKIDSISSPRRNIRHWTTVKSADPKCLAQLPADGFDITVTRAFIQDGEEVRRESFNTSYAATDKIVCEKPDPSASPTPVPTSTNQPSATPIGSAEPTEEPEEETGEHLLGPNDRLPAAPAPRSAQPAATAGRRRSLR